MMLELANVTSAGSPGGILPLLMSDTFDDEIQLTGRCPAHVRASQLPTYLSSAST